MTIRDIHPAAPAPLTRAERRAFMARRRAAEKELRARDEREAIGHDAFCPCDVCARVASKARAWRDDLAGLIFALAMLVLVLFAVRACQPEVQRLRDLEGRVRTLEDR